MGKPVIRLYRSEGCVQKKNRGYLKRNRSGPEIRPRWFKNQTTLA